MISCGCIYNDCNGNCVPHCDNVGPPNCPATTDQGMDFGNSYFNDHHFHYGYHIYAAAVITKFRPNWHSTYKEYAMTLVRDIANPSSQDPFFPKYRHKDIWAGNSWAGGFNLGGNNPFLYGRNQESSSESINGYYAVYLYGLASNNTDLANFCRYLLSLEIRTTTKYYHVKENSDVYPKSYWSKYKSVGIMWSAMIQFQTWFGDDPHLVYSIQSLPFTPISEDFLDPAWIKQEYPVFQQACQAGDCNRDGWIAFLLMEQAILDKASAWKNIMSLPDSIFEAGASGGNGNSRTNTLWWAATRDN